MEYQLNNPCDPYTFIAADKEIAALCVGLLSLTFGADTEDEAEENRVPICFSEPTYKGWYVQEFGRTPTEGLDTRIKEVGEALDSFMLGHFKDRARYNAALEAIDDPAKLEDFKAKWQDGRSSLNDIGTMAQLMGKEILKASAEARG